MLCLILVRERAKKARMKKTERPGDLSSLIDEISSQTPSLCSDLSEQPDGVTLLPSKKSPLYKHMKMKKIINYFFL